jgi:16S rRNA (guanine527-N7)-methyltransferase
MRGALREQVKSVSGRDAFEATYNVPRGTMAMFGIYAEMLTDWQGRMNLVGPSTLADIWGRHFADSAQVLPLAGDITKPWLDIGSGAGFPGIVVALLGATQVHLVESTAKKCRFLEAVCAATGVEAQVTVHNRRIESLPRFAAGIISARACANLGQLFEWGLPFATRATRWVLPKGATADEEVSAAREKFAFDAELVPSRSDERGRIVIASGVKRR